MSYSDRKYAVVAILALYFCAGVFVELKNGNREGYPVFSWRLFAVVQNTAYTFKIEIMELGDITYDPPLKFSESRFLFDKIDQSPTEYERAVRNLGLAIENNDVENIQTYRKKIEQIFPTDTYRYAVVEVSYDSLDYWRTHEYDILQTLAVYKTE